ncbi:MAG: hypothetical protein FD134_2403 [Gallionellaceae bacterium]|nr:MAG: hypothetical protein FD134_2403 [Gallionellaceae bacterium]
MKTDNTVLHLTVGEPVEVSLVRTNSNATTGMRILTPANRAGKLPPPIERRSKPMKTVGKRRERGITFHADGDLLREGALFNTEMQKMQSTFRFPRGVFRYKSHEEANRHMMECVVNSIVAVRKTRHD